MFLVKLSEAFIIFFDLPELENISDTRKNMLEEE